MKKIITILLVLAALLTVAFGTYEDALAASPITISLSLDKTQANVGETVTVTVKVSGASSSQKVAAIGFELGIPSGLVYKSKTLPKKDDFMAMSFSSDLNRLTAYGSEGITDSSWTALTVTYTVTADAVNGVNKISIKDNEILCASDTSGNSYSINRGNGAYITISGGKGTLTPGTQPGKGETYTPPQTLPQETTPKETEPKVDSITESKETASKAQNSPQDNEPGRTDTDGWLNKFDPVKAGETLKLKALSYKTSKGIKVVINGDVQQFIDQGYEVEYQFYRSSKAKSGYKQKIKKSSNTYTNTSGTKGTRYYFKARVLIKDKQGNEIYRTELKQCSYACRKFPV